MFRPNVISAIASRNIKTFFTNVTGYLFIVCFVVVSGIIAFGPRFFADNLATLDQLTNAYPLLLMFLIPAFTMGIWADEKRQGTDAILFTLPASDTEILFGKFLSVVVVYLAALFFSLAQLIALASIGTPDWGVIAATYVGYFLAGVSLLSIGMFASSLTNNTTVAFVLGAFLCAIPVFIGEIAPTSRFLQSFSIEWQLREFGQGSISLSNVLYFFALTAIGLFLNFVVITKRHWSSDEEGRLYWLYAAQVLSILVIAGSFYAISVKAGNYYDTELDMTVQRINTLSPTSIEVIEEAAAKRKVHIWAYVSDQVPTEFVATRKRLMRLLRQYAQRGGDMIELRVINIAPNSRYAQEATNAGIEKIDHVSEVGGRQIRQDVFLGVRFSSSVGESIIPRVDSDTPIEYELTRALGTVGVRQQKLRLGVLNSHASFMGLQIPMSPTKFEFNHLIVDELKQRYDVVQVSEADLTRMIDQETADQKEGNDTPADSKSKSEDAQSDAEDSADDGTKETDESASRITIPDVLLVVRPSRIDPAVQKQVLEYLSLGNPVVIMVDPLPIFPFTLFSGDGSIPETPKQKVVADQGGLFISDEENNDCSTLLDPLQVEWHGREKSVTFPEVPGRPNQFGGPPMGGRPERTVDAFYPTVISQIYQSFDDLRFEDIVLRFRSGGEVRESGMNVGEQQDGIPLVLGSPNALLIHSIQQQDFDPFNRDSLMTSGVDSVLMFYAGGIRKKTSGTESSESGEGEDDDAESASPISFENLEFTPLINVQPEAIGVPWDDIAKTEVIQTPGFPPRDQEVVRINAQPVFQALDLQIEALEAEINEAREQDDQAKVDSLTAEKERLEQLRQQNRIDGVCLAAHVKGTSSSGQPLNAVILTDSDMASNLYGAVADVLSDPPQNVEFLLNIIDTLGDREEFVSLRSNNPEERTLTYMDRKREEFRGSRRRQAQKMEREMNREFELISRQLQEEENEQQTLGGFISQLQGANKKLEIKEKQLREELEEDIARLKAEEARNLQQAEWEVRLQATLLPCLPALFLGIFVLIYRFIQERSFVNEKRRA